jgi:hypothetical protein
MVHLAVDLLEEGQDIGQYPIKSSSDSWGIAAIFYWRDKNGNITPNIGFVYITADIIEDTFSRGFDPAAEAADTVMHISLLNIIVCNSMIISLKKFRKFLFYFCSKFAGIRAVAYY